MKEKALRSKQAKITQCLSLKDMLTTLYCSYLGLIFARLASFHYDIKLYCTATNKVINYNVDCIEVLPC